jgi:amidophosphoribosyltransferase
MIREAGASEIHLRLGSPPITHSCFFGVDTPCRKDLLAAQKDIESIRDVLGADTLAFLSIDGLYEALGDSERSRFCMACFTGDYPEDICRKLEPAAMDITRL